MRDSLGIQQRPKKWEWNQGGRAWTQPSRCCCRILGLWKGKHHSQLCAADQILPNPEGFEATIWPVCSTGRGISFKIVHLIISFSLIISCTVNTQTALPATSGCWCSAHAYFEDVRTAAKWKRGRRKGTALKAAPTACGRWELKPLALPKMSVCCSFRWYRCFLEGLGKARVNGDACLQEPTECVIGHTDRHPFYPKVPSFSHCIVW